MRFLMMHKHDEHTERGELPPPELMAKMGAFINEHLQAGRFLDGAGLGATKTRTLLTFADGVATTTHPYPRRTDHESPAGMLVVKVTAREQALGWAERYGKILGNGAIELSKVTEPWDLGMMPMPEGAPLRFLLVEKEIGTLDTKQKGELTRLKTAMRKEGVLEKEIGLEPSTNAKRLFFKNNELTVVDGPFAESKELIGGFSVMEWPDVDAAIAMCKPYAEILGGNLEIDVRVVTTLE